MTTRTIPIPVIHGPKYAWQKFNFNYRKHSSMTVDTYCADGDGFVEIRVRNACIGLYDQGERIRGFDVASLEDAIAIAEKYADATYPNMLSHK